MSPTQRSVYLILLDVIWPCILVARANNPSGLCQESRSLAGRQNIWAYAEYLFCNFQPIRLVRFDNEFEHFWFWRRWDVSIPGADQKDHGLCGLEWWLQSSRWVCVLLGNSPNHPRNISWLLTDLGNILFFPFFQLVATVEMNVNLPAHLFLL